MLATGQHAALVGQERVPGATASNMHRVDVLVAQARDTEQTYSKGWSPLPCSVKSRPSTSTASPVPTVWKLSSYSENFGGDGRLIHVLQQQRWVWACQAGCQVTPVASACITTC